MALRFPLYQDRVDNEKNLRSCSIIYSSLEALLHTKWREVLENSLVTDRVYAVVVDEAHCVVSKWKVVGDTMVQIVPEEIYQVLLMKGGSRNLRILYLLVICLYSELLTCCIIVRINQSVITKLVKLGMEIRNYIKTSTFFNDNSRYIFISLSDFIK